MSAELGQPGQIIDGKYRIVRLLGSGGMGAVFEGENLRIRRRVAIKMLHGSVSSQPEVIARFEREAQAAALVGSEHICEVLDLGMLPDQTRYMVMEYLEGDTLSGLIKKNGRLKPAQSIPILTQILDALGAAHAAGIIHRDLKPDNVFILPQKGGITNFVKVLDFGVSKFSQMGGEAMNVTRAGAVVGTPYYMSPEQARGSSAIDQRTDVYAIGVLLYQASTGQVPYQAETFNELLFKIVLEVAPPPQVYVPDIDPEFAAIIQRAMAREPDQRFQSCQQFRDALVQFQSSRANPLPAFKLPSFPDGGAGGPTPARTEVLDLSKLPPLAPPPAPGANLFPGLGQSSPAATDGTMPMQPGLQLSVPGQSGANWAGTSNPGAIPVGPTGPTTANSWGNASSSNAGAKPRSGNGMLFGVVGVAALIGVGVAVAAVFMMGKPPPPKAAAQPTSAPTVHAVATVTPTVAATPSAPPADTVAPSVSASASAVPTASTAPTASAVAATAEAPTAKTPGPMPGAKGVAKPVTKPSGTGKPGGKPASGGGDLGY
jgi:serine/threonine-protein kinase